MKKQQNCHSTSMGTWGCSPEGGRGWGTGGVNRSASTDDNLTSSPGGNSPGTWTHVCVSSKWMDEGRRGAPCWRHQPLLWRLCHSPADADAPTPLLLLFLLLLLLLLMCLCGTSGVLARVWSSMVVLEPDGPASDGPVRNGLVLSWIRG